MESRCFSKPPSPRTGCVLGKFRYSERGSDILGIKVLLAGLDMYLGTNLPLVMKVWLQTRSALTREPGVSGVDVTQAVG